MKDFIANTTFIIYGKGYFIQGRTYSIDEASYQMIIDYGFGTPAPTQATTTTTISNPPTPKVTTTKEDGSK